MDYAIGVDVGGTKIGFAAVDRRGVILHKRVAATEASRGGEYVMNAVLEGIERVRTEAGDGRVLAGIGIGTAGQIDFNAGSVAFAGETLPGWTGMPIKRRVMERFGCEVQVDNDVNVIAIAEKVFGAGKRYGHFVCLALGTGVGGALVEDGRLIRGAFGGAGELGHVSVQMDGPRCGSCGNFGCLELYASGTGIARMGKERKEAACPGVPWEPNSREIIRAWTEGEPHATEIMEVAIRALGTAIAGFIHTFNPEAVIIGGGVADANSPFFEALGRVVDARTTPAMREACALLPAYIGSDAGVVGAAAQIWHYGNANDNG